MNRRVRSFLVVVFFAGLFAYFIHFIVKKSLNNHINDKSTLYVALDSKVQSFDPRLIGLDANSQYLEELRFLPLLSFDLHGNIIYRLAENITPKSNKSWVITLKSGVLFSSGQEITAEDVLATYQAILNPPTGFPTSPRRSAFKDVVKFIEISKDQIYIELKQPDASFLNNLVVGILPKEAVQNARPNEVTGKKFESGPFVLKKVTDTDIFLLRNENFNLNSPAKISKIDFRIIPDAGTRYAALMKGDIDLAQNSLDPDKIDRLKNEKKSPFDVIQQTKLATIYLGFNFKDQVVSKLAVRKAIQSAIDIKSIIQYRLKSDEEPANSMFPRQNYYYNSALPEVKFNPDSAKKMLKESGLKLPISLTIKSASSNKLTTEAAKAIKSYLSEVGFDVRIENLEQSVFQEQIRKGLSQVWISPWVGFKDPDHLRFVFASDMIPPNGGNRGYYSNPKLDKLLQQGREELDPEKRKLIYNQAQDIIAQDIPYVFLWHGENVAVVSKKVTGFNLFADGRYWSLVDVEKN